MKTMQRLATSTIVAAMLLGLAVAPACRHGIRTLPSAPGLVPSEVPSYRGSAVGTVGGAVVGGVIGNQVGKH